MANVLPNPALDTFRSKLTAETSLSSALALGREQLKGALEGKKKLYEKWRRSFTYVCAIVCMWSCFHVVELAKIMNAGSGDDISLTSPEAILMWRHLGSAFILFLLGTGKESFKNYALLLSCVELVTIYVLLDDKQGGVWGVNAGLEKKLKTLKVYPFASIMSGCDFLQEKYMRAEVKRSTDQFSELDRQILLSGGKKSSKKQK
jgi:hypothetical protein